MLRNDRIWTVSKGPDMPMRLTGHCIAAFNDHKIVIAGGFSSKTLDFIDDSWIYNTWTSEWYTQPWMKLKHGPRMDAACNAVSWMNETRVLMVGGWNNTGLKTTEMFDSSNWKWAQMASDESSKWFSPPLLEARRSNVLFELNNEPLLAGGIICAG